MITPEDGDGLISAKVPDHRDLTVFQGCHPASWFRSFVEPNRRCIGLACATDDLANTGPKDGSITHGARLATRDQFELRRPGRTKIEMPQSEVCVGQSHHFGVGERTVGGFHDIHPDGDEPACVRFEYGSAEGSTGSSSDVAQGELDDEPHAIASRHDRLLPAAHQTDGPGWKAIGRSG